VSATASVTGSRRLKGHQPQLSERVVEIETTGKLTDLQIMAKVNEHYEIDR
jgi:hypothetical protein